MYHDTICITIWYVSRYNGGSRWVIFPLGGSTETRGLIINIRFNFLHVDARQWRLIVTNLWLPPYRVVDYKGVVSLCVVEWLPERTQTAKNQRILAIRRKESWKPTLHYTVTVSLSVLCSRLMIRPISADGSRYVNLFIILFLFILYFCPNGTGEIS